MHYRVRAPQNKGFEVRINVPKHLQEYVGKVQVDRGLKTRDRSVAECKAIKVAAALLEEWEQLKLDAENGIQVRGPSFKAMALPERLRTVDEWVARYRPTAENHLKVLQKALGDVEDKEVRYDAVDDAMDRYRDDTDSSHTPALWPPAIDDAATRALSGTMLDAVADYLELPQVTTLRGNGAANARAWFKHLAGYLGDPALADVTPKVAHGYIQSLAASGMSKGSVSNRLSRFRRAWRYWGQMELVATNPWTDLKPSDFRFKATVDRQAFTPAQYQLLIGACSGKNKQIQMDVMLLAVTTGLRRLELMSLKTDDVETVQHEGTTRYMLRSSGEVTEKSANALRSVPVPTIATATVERLLRTATENQYEFLLGYNGDPRKRAHAVAHGLTERLKTIPGDWEGVTPLHSLRRSYVQTLMQSGVDTLAAKVLMGHTTGDLTFGLYGRSGVSTTQLLETVDAAYWDVWAMKV